MEASQIHEAHSEGHPRGTDAADVVMKDVGE
jgi:hypothetical protein